MKKLLIKTGTYQKDGETKNRWTQLGVIRSNENGEFALLDPSVNLAGCLMQQNQINPEKAGSRLMVSIFTDDRQNQQQNQQQPSENQNYTPPSNPPGQAAYIGSGVIDDDIPF